MNPRNPREFKKLTEAVRESRRKLTPFRERRVELVKLLCGSEYGEDGSAEAQTVYMNMMAQALNIYTRQLAARAPKAKITSPYRELRPMARNLSIACEDVAKETRLGRVLRRAVIESMVAPMAVVKVGLERTGLMEMEGVEGGVDVTEPFVSLVSYDDYVRDMSARSAYDPAYEGDTYYKTQNELREMYPDLPEDMFDPGGGESSGETGEVDMQGEEGEDRAESISHDEISGDDNFNGKIAMQDLWLPKERLLVTYFKNKPDKGPLNVIEYDTNERGPYHQLFYTDVPDNAMPLPPFSLLKNMQELASSLFRRLSQQARDQKRVVGFDNEQSANRFKEAYDGDGVWWEGMQPTNLEAGGIDQANLALLLQVRDMFSWSAGNLDSLGGLAPMSDTVGQEELMAQSASAQLADMQDAVAEFARGIFEQIAWYEWTDPVRERVLQKEIDGADITIPVKWTPETRQGNFLDFNFDINPVSMRDDNPAQKVQKIQAALMNVFLPMEPFLAAQGLTVDAKRLSELVADYSNMPELEQIIVPIDPAIAAEGQAGPVGNPKPAVTTRNYVRHNRPGATRQGKDKAMMQTLLGSKVQGDEMAALARGNI